MNYCYLRVSTNDQDTENQKHGVLEYANRRGLTKLQMFEDSVSSKVNWKQRGIGELINKRAKAGDVIIVSETSRLARTMLEVLEISEAVAKLEIDLHLVKSGIIVDGSQQGKIMLALTGMFAEMERDLIRGRTAESLQKRRQEIKEKGFFISKDGKKISNLGRPKGKAEKLKLDEKADEINDLLSKGINKASIAKFIGCSRSTLYDWLKRQKRQERKNEK